MKNRKNSANVGMGPRAGSTGSDTVAKFVEFQQTGAGFDAVWADLHPSQAANWARNERGSRKVKITPESGLEWNEVPGSTDGPSVVKREVAKIERPDLLPILEECINALPDPELRDVVRLQLHEGLSQREIAGRLQTSAATICRRLKDAYAEMRPLLEARGVDASWITAA
jgi:hypothetical protein